MHPVTNKGSEIRSKCSTVCESPTSRKLRVCSFRRSLFSSVLDRRLMSGRKISTRLSADKSLTSENSNSGGHFSTVLNSNKTYEGRDRTPDPVCCLSPDEDRGLTSAS